MKVKMTHQLQQVSSKKTEQPRTGQPDRTQTVEVQKDGSTLKSGQKLGAWKQDSTRKISIHKLARCPDNIAHVTLNPSYDDIVFYKIESVKFSLSFHSVEIIF